ncbi:hypothetical protein RP726_20945 (plasmid) [Candidatus Methylospira mobilis]|uniref:hypothetical protein n=1 Tax=Candidatus Methylospira mobilis TaxID=1808979 RepID=UPI0028E198F6|nr:hypothetical protein [Candidatus Methylospira mobilis]WNV06943.1 hypothetical protein RP726_20945 [Candidatus Methylospira mobilis]
MLQSCQNCWFNGLQYGALGLSVGYCSRHDKILNAAEGTTCGQHMRKDLSLKRAKEVASIHKNRYSDSVIINIYRDEEAEREISSDEKDVDLLRGDSVGDLVTNYGKLDTKIISLAQLNMLAGTKYGARAEVAMLSLARGYVSNCMRLNGNWTSGLHIYWWTKNRLAEIPDIQTSDIRTTGGINLHRQVDLTSWSIIMLRLTLIDDVIEHAATQNDPIGEVKGLLQKASEAVQTFNPDKLSKWMRAKAQPALDKKLTYERYQELSRNLHRDT